jgi:hypothetical protein
MFPLARRVPNRGAHIALPDNDLIGPENGIDKPTPVAIRAIATAAFYPKTACFWRTIQSDASIFGSRAGARFSAATAGLKSSAKTTKSFQD